MIRGMFTGLGSPGVARTEDDANLEVLGGPSMITLTCRFTRVLDSKNARLSFLENLFASLKIISAHKSSVVNGKDGQPGYV